MLSRPTVGLGGFPVGQGVAGGATLICLEVLLAGQPTGRAADHVASNLGRALDDALRGPTGQLGALAGQAAARLVEVVQVVFAQQVVRSLREDPDLFGGAGCVASALQDVSRIVIRLGQLGQLGHGELGALGLLGLELLVEPRLARPLLVVLCPVQRAALLGAQLETGGCRAVAALQILSFLAAGQAVPPAAALLLGRVHGTGGEVDGVAGLLAQRVGYAAQALVPALGSSTDCGERACTHGAAGEGVDVLHEVAGGDAVRVQVAQRVLGTHGLADFGRAFEPHRCQSAATERGRSHLAQSSHTLLAGELPTQYGGQHGVERRATERLDVGRLVQVLPRCTSHQLRVAHGALHELALELLVVHAVRGSWGTPAQGLAGELSNWVLRHPQQLAASVHGGGRQDRVLHGGGTLADVLQRPGGGVADDVAVLADVLDAADLGGVQALALLQRCQLGLESVSLGVPPAGAQGGELSGCSVGICADVAALVALAQGAHVLDPQLFQALLRDAGVGEGECVAEAGHVGFLTGGRSRRVRAAERVRFRRSGRGVGTARARRPSRAGSCRRRRYHPSVRP